MVADGMGGHHGGEQASEAVVAAIAALDEAQGFDARVAAVRAAIAQANANIFASATASGRQMGTTVVALVIAEERFAILWVGDSRAYLKRGAGFHRLTQDHSQAEELIAAGMLDRAEADSHPSSHILVRAIGVLPEVEPDLIDGDLAAEDVFLLCSDGLHNLVSESEMSKMIESVAFDRVSEQLVELGLVRGAPDNITVCTISAGKIRQIRPTLFGSLHQ